MSLNFSLYAMREVSLFDRNITHNLGAMAEACGVYKCLWRPTENGFKTARQIIPVLEHGLSLLKEKPEHFKKFNSENGWGMYEHFVPFVEGVLNACWENPDAKIHSCV